ncbi:glucosidase II beta subunit-like-domain-containing protein [Absidia repens]|uniref:Glucosidase II beta subunit-like-domain-containing protein n=1 Tax=Absidia repens TaxID=90262 RepID=A0A1X2IK75_9FUNG|nr:glucosidase II beta subunit-like-domain-containing protein [Absidia repens]
MVATHSLWTIPCILAAIQLVQASTKGVAPEKLDLYRPDNKQQWKCLDGSKTISFSAINDDYCDCPDGSDEPGTSACPNGYFYCENKGHLPAYIKTWSVNDGVCDEECCDGSDEYNGLTHCPNRCKEVASEYQKTQAEIRRLTSEGYAVKKKLIEEAEIVVRDWQEEKSKYEDDLVLKRVDALEKEAQRHTITTDNKQRTRSPRCTKNNARQELLENRVKQLRDEIDVLLSILHDMKRDHNHNVQDKAVKIAIAGYDDFLAEYDNLREDMDQLDAEVENNDDDDVDDSDDDVDDAHFANEGESTAETEGKQASTISKKIMGKLEKVLPSSWKDRIFSNGQGQNDDGQNIRDGLDVDVRGLETKIKDVDEKLNNDYGKQREWLKLQNTCVEKDDGE